MRRIIVSMAFMLSAMIAFAGGKLPKKMEHVHPLFWWADMKTTSLQVMLHAQGIGDCDVALSGAKGVAIERVERVGNPNYLFVYLDVAGAKAHAFSFVLSRGRERLTVPYALKERDGVQPKPFDASDVLYLLMPDRFVNGDKENDDVVGMRERGSDPTVADARHGGDVKGMEKALDYLADLGVTAVWPTPVQVNDMPECSYHGYAITDYYQIDPRFGTNEAFASLIGKMHSKGIKMVMDLVFNHCGSENFLFRDMPAADWFNHGANYVQTTYRTGAVGDVHSSKSDVALTQDGWFVLTMPDFNQRNPLVLDYLVQAAIWWTEYAHIDGIRQDTYPYCDTQAMAEWCRRMDKEYPGYNIVGETWLGSNVGVSWWQKGSRLSAPLNTELPTVMDFPLMNTILAAVDEETNGWDKGMARVYEYISQDIVYADPMHLLTFLANHDTDRFAKNAAEAKNVDRYRQALTLLLTLRGIPELYFGDEIGMDGNKSHGDGALRKDFPVGALTAEGRDALQEEYHSFTKRMLNWRKGSKAVAKGKLVHFPISQGCYVYSRMYEGEVVTVFVNGTGADCSLDLAQYSEVLPSRQATDIATGEKVNLGDKLSLKARQVCVLSF